MPGFPKTRDKMIAGGYRFSNHAKCKGPDCGAEIEWWETPRGKKMPFDHMQTGESPAKPHWGSCPNAKQF